MPLVIWTRNFLEGQGYTVQDNVIYQDNTSAMQLEKNGRASSGCRTRHIDIRYFFITDRVKRGNIWIEHCPTDDMLGVFFTKPLQGSKFRKFRWIILNEPVDVDLGARQVPQECVGGPSYADVVRNGIAHDPMTSSRKELMKNGTAAAGLTKLNLKISGSNLRTSRSKKQATMQPSPKHSLLSAN